MKLKTYTTTYDEKNVKIYTENETEFYTDMDVENNLVNIYDDMEYQTMEGFGGAVTDSAGYIYSLMNESQKKELISTYFKKGNLNYNIVRIPIDSCDFSLEHFEADFGAEDETFEKFSFERVEKYILPMLEDVKKEVGENLQIMLSPWSPPAYMKSNKERNFGGVLLEEFKERYAKYICRYIKEYISRGYKIDKLTMQNEPKAVQTWDSCIFTAESQREFLVKYLMPALKEEKLDYIEIYIWDHNKERSFEWAKIIIDDETDDMVAGIAFHWYSGDHFESLRMIKEKFPNKKLLLSEACIEFSKFSSDDFLKNAQKYANEIIGNLNEGMNTFIDWNLALDQEGGPNHVKNFCDAPYLFDIDKKELMQRNILHYLYHFSHFILPEAKRIGISRFTENIKVTAFKNPDGKIVMVLLNMNDCDMEVIVRKNDECAKINIPSNAIMSAEIV